MINVKSKAFPGKPDPDMHNTVAITPWKSCGDLWAITDEHHGSFGNPAHGLAVCGSNPDPGNTRSMLAISRLPRRTDSAEPWLDAVRRIIDRLTSEGNLLISSAGSLGWEYITWCAGKSGLDLWLVLPPASLSGFRKKVADIRYQLELNPGKVTFFMPVIENRLPRIHGLRLRDALVFRMSHRQYVVSLRKSSGWENIIGHSESVNRKFETAYPRTQKSAWLQLVKNGEKCSHSDLGNILVHWTRGSYGPWSGERTADYFEALSQCHSGNPRDGFETLKHILHSGVIHASGKMTRGGFPVVSATAVHPFETLDRITYRNALGYWNYEPYGIGADKDALCEAGFKPVIYGEKELYDKLLDEQKPLYQFSGRSTTDRERKKNIWLDEQEWRHAGDFDFSQMMRAMILFVPTKKEAAELRKITANNVIDFETQFHKCKQ